MPSLRAVLVAALPLLAAPLAHTYSVSEHSEAQPQQGSTPLAPNTAVIDTKAAAAAIAAAAAPVRPATWQDMLNAVPAESLHAALHQVLQQKFQDGVYESDAEAAEHVHSQDPPLATRLLQMAQHELKRRQVSGGNNTTPNPPVTPTDTPAPPASTPNPPPVQTPTTPAPPPPVSTPVTPPPDTTVIVVPVPVPTTDSAGSPTTTTVPVVVEPTTSIPQTVTGKDSQGSSFTSTTTVPVIIVTETNSAGVVTTSTAIGQPTTLRPAPTTPVDVTTTAGNGATVVLSAATPGKVFTTTDAKGSTFITTYTPPGVQLSSLVLRTTTLPNGQRSVITSFALITAGGTPTGSAGAGNTRAPSLQGAAPGQALPTGAARAAAAGFMAAVGGAVMLL